MRCRLLFAVGILAAGSSPRLTGADDVSIVAGKTDIEFKVGKSIAAKYHIDPAAAKPYLWPLFAPGDVRVTRAWPMQKGVPGETTDHIHQKSAWFTHGDVIPEGITLNVKSNDPHGKGVDFWSEAKQKGTGKPLHGSIVCVKVGQPKQVSRDHAEVTTWNEWRTPGGVKIMDEVRTLHLIERPTGRLFVFDCTLQASVCPIAFGDTKEGSFGVRVPDAFRTQLPTGGTVTAADGTTIKAPAKDNLSVWGKPSDWHDYSGVIDGHAVGIAVFDHPRNASRAAWHTRAYGLMAANPFGRTGSGFPSQKGKTELVRIPKGESLRLRYAIFAHTGNAEAGKVAEAYDVFKGVK